MKKVIIITLSWLLVLFWMGLIYYLSDMSGTESTNKSEKVINKVIEKTIETTNEIGITNKDPKSKNVQKTSSNLDYPLRKMMHFTMYLILELLLINALFRSGLKNKKLLIYSFIIAFLYACSDEYHQSFSLRTASFLDVLIDTSGIIVAILFVLFIKRLKKKAF